MSAKKKFYIFISVIFGIITVIISGYLYMGYKFGEAASEAIIKVVKIDKQWRNKKDDSLKSLKKLDSISLMKKSDSIK